ncbi:hypothetical protein GGR53DRAFT_346540 [Hypoxylon sp. FL1150]|nr:hypothetical protein GGR53DRAFT_346540 [Hypoxylon sp. FL1150]
MPSSAVPPSRHDLAGSGESSHRRQDSFGSSFTDRSDKEKVSRVTSRTLASPKAAALNLTPSQDSRESTSSSQYEDYRRMLASHAPPTRQSTASSSKPHHSPTVNVYTHCGRHTDQYLFSGWSNIVKSPFRKH